MIKNSPSVANHVWFFLTTFNRLISGRFKQIFDVGTSCLYRRLESTQLALLLSRSAALEQKQLVLENLLEPNFYSFFVGDKGLMYCIDPSVVISCT